MTQDMTNTASTSAAAAPSTKLATLTTDAINAIGQDDPNADWKLEPQTHAGAFPDQLKTGPLRRILAQDDIGKIVEDYCTGDAAALKAQGSYKFWGMIGIYATMAATLLGALAFLPFREVLGLPEIKGGVFIAQYGALALAFIASAVLARKHYYNDWQKHRGAAEIARLNLFDAVLAASAQANAGELPPLPLKLEYFRRFLLDMQQRYYSGSAQKASEGARRSRNWRWFSNAVYALLALLAIPTIIIIIDANGWFAMPGIVDFLLDIPLVKAVSLLADQSLLAVGIMASAIYAANGARSRMDMDEHNAARYLVTSQNLDYLADGPLAVARAAAVAGDEAAVKRFVGQVRNQISAEHKQWVLLADALGPADVT